MALCSWIAVLSAAAGPMAAVPHRPDMFISSQPPVKFTVGGMAIELTGDQSMGSITPVSSSFEFLPPPASTHVSHRLGDVTLLVRTGTSGAYTQMTSATRGRPNSGVVPIPTPAGELAAATLVLTSSADDDAPTPLVVERHYAAAAGSGGGLKMWFTVKNAGSAAVEIGGFGAAMIFADKSVSGINTSTLDSLAAFCAMVDPAIASNHGWVSVTRMTGEGKVLLVSPDGATDFQAYRKMDEAGGGNFHELTSLTAGWVERDWANASLRQWVEPGSVTVQPGDAARFGYRVMLADSVRDKDAALAAAGFAVIQAVPSYAIATDMKAFLHVLPPKGTSIGKVAVEPTGAIVIGRPKEVGSKGFFELTVAGKTTGRVRVTIGYSDGTSHVASYFVMPPLDEHVAKYAAFMATVAWYDNITDPFSRGHSVLAWNRESKMHIGVGAYDNGYEDNRIFNNGLSDEAGAGAHVGFAAAVGGLATPSIAAKLDLYINDTLYGLKPGLPFGASLQCVEGEAGKEAPSCGPATVVGPTADGVMASMFWVPTSASEPKMPGYDYDPRWFCDRNTPKTCPAGWPGWRWDQARGASLGRAYNYAHVSSTYLGMYQAATYDKQKTIRPRLWYLNRAYKTIVAMAYQASWYSHQGLMDGTNFWTILVALQDEGMHKEAAVVEEIMRNRTVVGVQNQCRYYVIDNVIHDLGVDKPGCHWYQAANVTSPWVNQTGLPGAGSEFSWDTTGQEEAYIWGRYFNNSALAMSSLNQILAYSPLVPNWAWHGSAFGEGDFGNNGVYRANERVLQHYRSGLNAIPPTEEFLRNPHDFYLLRLAAGSVSGVLTNIDVDGAPSMAFHGDPGSMFFDPASGDHGLAYYGHSHITQSFVVAHPDLGWLCYFCNLNSSSASEMVVAPRDTYRRKIYVGPLGLQIISDAGVFESARLATAGGKIAGVVVTFGPVADQPLSHFRLRLLTRSGSKVFTAKGLSMTRGGYVIAPTNTNTAVTIEW